MEDLKTENDRLQRLVDILDSQPDLVFSVLADGQITFMSEKTKLTLQNDESTSITHLNQILFPESMDFLLDHINQIKLSAMNGIKLSTMTQKQRSLAGEFSHIHVDSELAIMKVSLFLQSLFELETDH
jgi:hypothetical protein